MNGLLSSDEINTKVKYTPMNDVTIDITQGDCLIILKTLPEKSINCCITSPPYYGLRDYGNNEQLGLEKTPAEYIKNMVAVFHEVKRVLKDDGTLWLNIGDSYSGSGRHAGSLSGIQKGNKGSQNFDNGKNPLSGYVPDGLKPKDLVGIPWMMAFALRADGWYLRQDIIWHKPNPMPESVRDRCTKAHEYIFLLSKSKKYFYDSDAIKERSYTKGGLKTGSLAYSINSGRNDGNGNSTKLRINRDYRNKRSVWTVTTKPYKGAHFATFPPSLIIPCIKAGCPRKGTILDPFLGAGTTAIVSSTLGRNCIGIELNPEYCKIAENRLAMK